MQSGQGEAAVQYTVAANPLPSARAGTITVASERVQVTQSAAPCRFQLSQDTASIGAAGGGLSVDLTTLTGCAWTATADVSWIDVSPASRGGSASATIQMQVAANTDAARVGHVNIGGQTYTVQQVAGTTTTPSPSPPPSPSPEPSPSPSPSPPPTGGQSITLEGVALAVMGRCPDIFFLLSGYTVLANHDTTVKRGNCSDVSTGDTLKVSGTTRSDGGVDASVIEIRKNE